jgi:hypothetical protein
MINKKLLITYLKIQRREYEKQVTILQKELDTPLSCINKQKYRTEKFLCDSMTTVIHVYTDLIENVENGEFDDEKKNIQIANSLPTNSLLTNSLPTNSLPPYNEDFINEMKRIEQEKSEKFSRR